LKIFILKPSSLGDVVHALPVLRLLKRHQPASEIYWWIDASLAPLLEGDPDLTGLVRFERQRWRSPGHWPEAWQSLRAIRGHAFDWVIDLQSLARSGTVAWLANGRFTIGLDDAREGARGFYDSIVSRPSPNAHAVDWYLGVLPALGVPIHWNFAWLPERPAVAEMVRQKWPQESARWIVLHPGARWPNKRWPVEHAADLVKLITQAQAEVWFAIIGSRADRELGRAIVAAGPQRCLDLTGQTSLWEMIEWIRRSELMITNDTGPMHVAAALQKPVVALFGPTHPSRTGPYGQLDRVLRSHLPCAPCLKDSCSHNPPLECLQSISPATVFEVVQQRLNARQQVAPS
jgi:lipopolysaccharide heptosyltransferase II